jgi:hypothetical protein
VIFAVNTVGATARTSGQVLGLHNAVQKRPQASARRSGKIFALLAQKKVDPLVNRTLPLLEARQALELPSSDSVECKFYSPISIVGRRTLVRKSEIVSAAASGWMVGNLTLELLQGCPRHDQKSTAATHCCDCYRCYISPRLLLASF